MGPINGIAVFLAACLAMAVRLAWYGLLFRSQAPRPSTWAGHATALAVMLLAALMMGHNFARVGAAVLAVKPWLYWMMSGGLAIAFVMPAIWLGGLRHGADRRLTAIDCGFWLAAYLAMGTFFWLLR